MPNPHTKDLERIVKRDPTSEAGKNAAAEIQRRSQMFAEMVSETAANPIERCPDGSIHPGAMIRQPAGEREKRMFMTTRESLESGETEQYPFMVISPNGIETPMVYEHLAVELAENLTRDCWFLDGAHRVIDRRTGEQIHPAVSLPGIAPAAPVETRQAPERAEMVPLFDDGAFAQIDGQLSL